jgi:glycerol-3-phosphate dehydrogenase
MVWGSSGVRPLYDDAIAHASAFTRDCVPGFDDAGGQAPAFSVFGGKIRTYSRLAEHAIENIMHHFPGLRKAWTGHAVRPGDAVPEAELGAFPGQFLRQAPFLPAETVRRLAQASGTEARALVGGSSALAGLGEAFNGGLTAAEVDCLDRAEWARTAEDVLWRRSKLVLRTTPEGAVRRAASVAPKAEAP